MIPTAGFADESSWEWCFDGLPHNSTVAVTTIALTRLLTKLRMSGHVILMTNLNHPAKLSFCHDMKVSRRVFKQLMQVIRRQSVKIKFTSKSNFGFTEISFFDYTMRTTGTYTPKDESSSEPMREPFEFGAFWNDFQWFAKNDDELRFYSDESRTNCVAQFRRLQVVLLVTVATMKLASFKKMLNRCDDVEFFYRKVYYNFMREDNGINIYRGHGYQQIVYHAAADTDADEIVNAKIFSDGKSIAAAQAEVEL